MKLQTKNRRLALAVAGSISLFFAVPSASQAQEIPLTTRSAEARTFFDKGQAALDHIQIVEARENFDKAIALDSTFAMAYLSRAPLAEHYTEVKADLAKAEALKGMVSPSERLYIDIIAAGLRFEDLQKRTMLTDQLLSMFPSSERALFAASAVAGDRGDNPKALEYCRRIASLYPEKGNVYNALGYLRISMQDLEGAEKDFRRYTELSPSIPNSHDSYAEVLLMLGRHEESIAEYEKALQIDPNFVSALAGIGNNYLWLEDYPKARDYYSQIHTRAKDVRDSLTAAERTAISFMYEGRLEESVNRLSDIYEGSRIDNSPFAMGALNTIVSSSLGSGKHAEALQWIEKTGSALDVMDASQGVKEFYEAAHLFHRSWYLAATGQITDAKAVVEKLRALAERLQDQSALYRLHHAMGIIETYAGNPSAALMHLEKANPINEFVMYQKAQNLGKLGKNAEAQALYQKIAALRNSNAGLAVVHRLAVEATHKGEIQTGK